MKSALRGSYVEVVFYMGINERYPMWFTEELYNCTFTDDSNYTFWVPEYERSPDYHEKILVEDYSVFIRKENGDIHVTSYDVFDQLYYQFRFDRFDNSGLAAFREDVIDYVECFGGSVISGYPDWFYEHFTESVIYQYGEESIFIDRDDGELSVTHHVVFLRNKFGEIRVMDYDVFLKYYEPHPDI